MIAFRFSPEKARAAIQWMIAESPRIDLHTLLKACYFADKAHLNKYGRPVFGATYRAMRFGPVPLEIYEMAKCEPYWLAEMRIEEYPWRLEGFRLRLTGNDPDLSALSETDREELNAGLQLSKSMTFTERTAATHGRDWRGANLGPMKYEDMFDDPDDERIPDLRQSAAFIRL